VTNSRLLVVDLAATSTNWALPPDGYEAIRAAAPDDWAVHFVRSPAVSDGDGGTAPSADAVEAIRDAEVYFGFGMSQALYANAPRLRWIQSAAAGVAALLFPALRDGAVVLTNSAGVHAEPIADHVLGGLLYLVRALDVAGALQREGRWDKQPFVGEGGARVRELGECRALVVGTGGIGRAVARRLAAFGVECTGLRRRPELGAPDGFERVAGLDALERELPSADVLVLAAPHTPATGRLLTVERLDLLPDAAIVVNVARGALLDEHALAARVCAGRLRGAVLDVFEAEPLAAESPLWALRQVVLTPHVAAVSPRRFWQRELVLFFENWRRYRAGEALLNTVDKHAGY
jgi:phosphoglycerate dehydrogenase-like enzyme